MTNQEIHNHLKIIYIFFTINSFYLKQTTKAISENRC